jgi:hypothetical protein
MRHVSGGDHAVHDLSRDFNHGLVIRRPACTGFGRYCTYSRLGIIGPRWGSRQAPGGHGATPVARQRQRPVQS